MGEKEADEWQEVAMNTKKEGEAAVRRVQAANTELTAQITTLELTKQAMQKEADVKSQMMQKIKMELEEKITASEAEKLNFQRQAREVADSAHGSKREMESRLSALEIEKDKRQQEADEWQEVAMNTKREADIASNKALKACQDLDAEIATLQATKAAMQWEAEVKAESMARIQGNADDKTSELEVKILEMQKKIEDVSRNNLELGTRIVATEEEKASMVREAEECKKLRSTRKEIVKRR